MQIHVIVDLQPEVKELLRDLVEALKGKSSAPVEKKPRKAKPVADTEPPPTIVEDTAPAIVEDTPQEYTLAQVRGILAGLGEDLARRPKLKELLQEYATVLSDVPPEKFAELVNRAKAL